VVRSQSLNLYLRLKHRLTRSRPEGRGYDPRGASATRHKSLESGKLLFLGAFFTKRGWQGRGTDVVGVRSPLQQRPQHLGFEVRLLGIAPSDDRFVAKFKSDVVRTDRLNNTDSSFNVFRKRRHNIHGHLDRRTFSSDDRIGEPQATRWIEHRTLRVDTASDVATFQHCDRCAFGNGEDNIVRPCSTRLDGVHPRQLRYPPLHSARIQLSDGCTHSDGRGGSNLLPTHEFTLGCQSDDLDPLDGQQ